jgi:hypothetical protein
MFFCQWQPYFSVDVEIESPYGLHKRRKTRERGTLLEMQDRQKLAREIGEL